MTSLKNYFSFLLIYYILSFINGISSEINTDQTSSPLNLSDELIDSTFNIVANQDSVLNSSSTKPGIVLESLTDTDQNSNVYSITGNEVLENETTPNVIVIHNNVSTNKSQQTKPNLTVENNYSEVINEKNTFIHNEDSKISTENKSLEPSVSETKVSEELINKTSSSLNLLPTINNQSETSNLLLKPSQLTNSFNDLIEYKLNETNSDQSLNDEKIDLVASDLLKANDKISNYSLKNINEKNITSSPSDLEEAKDFTKILVNQPDVAPELYAPFSSLQSSLSQSNHQKNKSIVEKNISSSQSLDQELSNKNNYSTSNPPNLLEHLYSTNTENRLRWINNHYTRNRLPPYPPKQPHLPGIPSGFRNPVSTINTLPPSNNNNIPSGMINGVSTPPLNIGNNSPYLNTGLGTKTGNLNTNNLNLASIVNSLSNTNNYGNPVPNIASFPYPPANSHSNLISSASILTPSNYPNNNALINPSLSPEVEAEIEAGLATATHSFSRRPGINITRVEHIAAECSDDYMKVIINFNGTFTGLVYSSGYVHDANCIYVNGTGRNGYEFYIRLNQCGTMGREEMHHPKRPGEVRRRDQVMWNTLSIQYNGMIEEEWDEHYRVTCEYGSDYWKTVTFPSFNVEVNTGSPVVFTINPPQCQMEVRRGFGIAGSRTSGPVTVGDPLTLLIHMKSEKAGFDILVKNCISHNGANQRLQLIDTNGCVTNEKLISPFRGTYNSDDGHQVTLYAYLKAFRFTGSPALYLECDIHMCHNKCPPQRCYWRNLSKRSTRSIINETYYDDQTYGEPIPMGKYNFTLSQDQNKKNNSELISESLSLFQALEVRHSDDNDEDYEKRKISKKYKNSDLLSSEYRRNNRREDFLKYIDELDEDFINEELIQNKFCFTGFNLLFITISTIIVLMSAVSTSILSCIKLRKLKTNFYRYDNERDRMSAISKSTSSKTMFYGQPHFSRRY